METLGSIFATTTNVLLLSISDLDDGTARRRWRGTEGPSAAWTVGHLLHYRCRILGLLGVEREDPWAAAFGDGVAATDGAAYPTLETLRAAWLGLQRELEAALAGAPADLADRPASGAGEHGETRVGDRLAFCAWHEGYHVGALGAARKALGLAGPAELVVAAQRG